MAASKPGRCCHILRSVSTIHSRLEPERLVRHDKISETRKRLIQTTRINRNTDGRQGGCWNSAIIGGFRCYSSNSSRKNEQRGIREAEVVRETKIAVSSKNQQRIIEEQEHLERLEAQLGAYLEQYQVLIAKNDFEKYSNELREALMRLISVYESLEYWEEALVMEQALLDQHDAHFSLEERADAVYRQGKLHMRLGDLSQAQRLYQRSLDCLQGGPNEVLDKLSPQRGNVMISMAGVHFHRGRLEESLLVLMEAEPNFISSDTPHVDLIKCLQHQGLLYRSMQDFQSARVKYESALDVLQLLRSQFSEIMFHEKLQGLQLDLADMLAAIDENDGACKLYEQILRENQAFHRTTDPTALEGIILHSLGRIHAQSEDTRELALQELLRALELKQQVVGDTHPEVLKTLNALGALYAVMKNQAQALQCFQQSLLIARIHAKEDDDEEIMLILRNIAVLKGEKVAKWGEET